jgi:hypothetical protein
MTKGAVGISGKNIPIKPNSNDVTPRINRPIRMCISFLNTPSTSHLYVNSGSSQPISRCEL